ncbi:MurR/RpiR family transcriptional regulator [Beduini massiliensis]|uniref:MurR/RpiR family transcriptional regulator n=1 Tax=Beduini massiliensis TaxID=1585974 RepID=UPI00059A9AEE|nr:MurR/RpiR family transcriptional regulator [Beduini massiliensis]
MNYLFYRLVLFVNSSSKDDLNYTIADFILKNISEIAEMNIVVFANTCHVSPASISRFCRKLGYDDYIHLKMECAKYTSLKSTDYYEPVMLQDPKKASAVYLKKAGMRLEEQIDLLDWEVLEEFVEDIHDSNNVAFYGSHFSHSIAQLIQAALLSCNKYSIAKNDSDQQIKIAESLDADSIAITISVRGNYLRGTQRLKRAIEKSGAKSVLITANHDPKLLKEFDRVIYISSDDDLYMGRFMLLSFAELISQLYVTRFGDHRQG